MTITLYKVTDKINKIGKTYSSPLALTGNLRNECSILDPVVEVANATMDYNYAWITEFARLYFIKNATIMRTGIWRLDMHVDVLETYKTSILALSAIIKRQQTTYNLYLDDPMFQAQNKRQIQTKRIGTGGFTPSTLSGSTCCVLTIAGGGM